MKRAALFLMISEKVRQELLKVVAGMEAGEMKTKRFAEMFRTLGAAFPMLVVTGKASAEVRRAIRNIKSLSVCPYTSVNPYDLWRVRTVLFTKDGMEDFISYFVKGEKP
jgi:ribosomal protein L4